MKNWEKKCALFLFSISSILLFLKHTTSQKSEKSKHFAAWTFLSLCRSIQNVCFDFVSLECINYFVYNAYLPRDNFFMLKFSNPSQIMFFRVSSVKLNRCWHLPRPRPTRSRAPPTRRESSGRKRSTGTREPAACSSRSNRNRRRWYRRNCRSRRRWRCSRWKRARRARPRTRARYRGRNARSTTWAPRLTLT